MLCWFYTLLVATFALPGYTDDAVQSVCREQTNAVQQCHWITGTITASNGTPSIRIRPQGERLTARLHLHAISLRTFYEETSTLLAWFETSCSGPETTANTRNSAHVMLVDDGVGNEYESK